MSAPLPSRRIFVLAGEPSGDIIGARVMQALRRLSGEPLSFAGIGGPRMTSLGLESLFPMEELSLMGFAEVVPHLPRLLRRLRETRREVERFQPHLTLTIDSPSFALRLQRRLAGQPLTRVHYVAPQVWAWRQGRAAKLGTQIDHLMALLPFEPPFFERHGLPCSFVGHPIVEEVCQKGDGVRFRRRYEIAADAPVLCLLPGSRIGEIEKHMPVLEATVIGLWQRFPRLRLILPTLPHLLPVIRNLTESWPVQPLILEDRADRFDAYAASWAAIAASGTVSLELALAGLPMVTIYKTGKVTAWLARRMIKVSHVNLVNLILDHPAVPELLQEDCTPDRIIASACRLLEDERLRNSQIEALQNVAAVLGGDGATPPSHQAAALILNLLDERLSPGPLVEQQLERSGQA